MDMIFGLMDTKNMQIKTDICHMIDNLFAS